MMACSFMPIGCFAPPKAALLFAVPALTNVLTRTARLATLAAMAFEWNEDNRKAHLLKHGGDFPDAPPRFHGPTLHPPNHAPTPCANRWAVSSPSPIPGEEPAAASSAREKPMPVNEKNIT